MNKNKHHLKLIAETLRTILPIEVLRIRVENNYLTITTKDNCDKTKYCFINGILTEKGELNFYDGNTLMNMIEHEKGLNPYSVEDLEIYLGY